MTITRTTTVLFSILFATHALAQQASGAADTGGEVPLGGFPGCHLVPPKDSCDARIACTGVGTLYGNTGTDLQAATQEGSIEARNELAKFYSSKQKAQESLAKVREDAQKSTSDGGKATSSSATRMIASVSSTSAEAILSGVQILSREVDPKQQTVTVEVGVSCKSQAAAAQSQAVSARSTSPSSSGTDTSGAGRAGSGAEEYRTPPGQLSTFKQTTPHADDF
ncbi:hypothetical protein [Burkholderia sp. L27(2015)]|uniref:hypothetical protein n=1 Tax=Burkholderia sp. L27(2015) TaxID=1641858 RepID=UPI00131C1A3E|nr:hypothetical protein [Burkholderia sp. L27(2015)]